MTRNRRSARQAGTRWETAIVGYLRDQGWPHAERRARTGAHDQGDITGVVGVCIEAKDTARFEPARFLTEAQTEAVNAKAGIGAAWIKRRGKSSPGDGYVLLDGATFTQLLREAGYQ